MQMITEEFRTNLEEKYGVAMAQDIMDELHINQPHNANDNEEIDFWAIKTLSELTEDFRADAQAALKALKHHRAQQTDLPKDIVNLTDMHLTADFNKAFQGYLKVQHHFYASYRAAIAPYLDMMAQVNMQKSFTETDD